MTDEERAEVTRALIRNVSRAVKQMNAALNLATVEIGKMRLPGYTIEMASLDLARDDLAAAALALDLGFMGDEQDEAS